MMESAISTDNIKLFIDEINKLVDIENKKKGGALAVAITHGHETIYQRYIGQASFEHAVAAHSGTKFYLASASKQFTAFCIALLEKEGKLCVNDKVRQYLDYLPTDFSDITIAQLIHHISGLRDELLLYNLAGKNTNFDHRNIDLASKLIQRQQVLNFTPGEYHLYCNTGYNLLGEIVKVVSGKSLREYAEENVFAPLKMKDTSIYDDASEIIFDRAMGYSYKNESNQWVRDDLNDSVAGAGAVYSTVNDLCRWIRAFYSPSIVQDLLPQLSRTPQLANGNISNYAYGLIINQREGQKIIQHSGRYVGFRVNVYMLPDAKLGIAITTATDIDVVKLVDQCLDVLFNPDGTKPEKQPCRTSNVDITGIFRGVKPYPYIITKEDSYLLGDLLKKGNPIIFNHDGTFQEEGGKDRFRPIIKNDRVIALEQIDEDRNTFYLDKRINEGSIDIQRLSGSYYSHEAEAILTIAASGDGIYIDGIIYPEKREVLQWIFGNVYFSPSTEFVIDFELNSNTNKPHLFISNSRCWKIEFVPI